jgi:hypothetical protein
MKIRCEIFIAMDEDDGYIVHTDESEVINKLGEGEGGYQARVARSPSRWFCRR